MHAGGYADRKGVARGQRESRETRRKPTGNTEGDEERENKEGETGDRDERERERERSGETLLLLVGPH